MKYFIFLSLFVYSFSLQSQSILGQWVTIDDYSNKEKAIVEIYQNKGEYFAKIVKSFISNDDARCVSCEGDKKNTPIKGLVFIEGLSEDGDEYNGGTILDPETGKVYKCYVKLVNENKLEVRGYLGFSFLGRTQYWKRKE